MVVPRLWVSIKVAAQATGRTEKALYEQIRKDIFPFAYRRAGSAILVSARDLGLLDLNTKPQSEEASTQGESLAATA
jgi:hypothetical protein